MLYPSDICCSYHPWLYDLNVSHNGKENTYTFRYLNKNITLKPCRLKELLPSPSPKPSPTVYLLHLEELFPSFSIKLFRYWEILVVLSNTFSSGASIRLQRPFEWHAFPEPSSLSLIKVLGALDNSKGIIIHSNKQSWVLKAVFHSSTHLMRAS